MIGPSKNFYVESSEDEEPQANQQEAPQMMEEVAEGIDKSFY